MLSEEVSPGAGMRTGREDIDGGALGRTFNRGSGVEGMVPLSHE
jgi:hypothetical protein